MQVDKLVTHTVCIYCGNIIDQATAAVAEDYFRKLTECTVLEASLVYMAHTKCAVDFLGSLSIVVGAGWKYCSPYMTIMCRSPFEVKCIQEPPESSLKVTTCHHGHLWRHDRRIESMLKFYGGEYNKYWAARRLFTNTKKNKKSVLINIINTASQKRFTTIRAARQHAKELMLASMVISIN